MKKYILKDLVTNKYWYGWYTSEQWTDDPTKATIFSYKHEIKDRVLPYLKEIENKVLSVITIYSNN